MNLKPGEYRVFPSFSLKGSTCSWGKGKVIFLLSLDFPER